VDCESASQLTGCPSRRRQRIAAWGDELRLVPLFLALCLTSNAFAAEVIPPKPDRYFNDYAHVVSDNTALQFNEQLAQFERDTSNQVLVAVFPKMQSDSDVADYGQRVAQAWGVGSKKERNGVVLLVFISDHKISLQVGYGLEGALPDAIAYDIRANRITPKFRQNDYAGGLSDGINSIEQAIRGEYKGTGLTNSERQRRGRNGSPLPLFISLIVFFILLIRIGRAAKRGYHYSGFGGPYIGGWGGGSGGGWSSGGGGGGFSGFSGGGGSFGGGGSSGGW
jgi:uncharacterized protein